MSRLSGNAGLADGVSREEQHDDKILLELLRCFRALLMTHVSADLEESACAQCPVL